MQGNGTMTFAGGRLTIGTLAVGPGRVDVVAESGAVPHVTALSITGTSKVDLADGAMIDDYSASPLPAARAFVISGYDGGSWDGSGIVSSAAAADAEFGLGYAEAASVFTTFPASFGGFTVDDTAALVRHTRRGDAKLDGVVNLDDFNRLAANFGAAGSVWPHGDFDYDAAVDLQDFNLLAGNFGLSAVGPEVTPQDWAALASAVPEPSAFLATLLTLPALCRRRRGSPNHPLRSLTVRG